MKLTHPTFMILLLTACSAGSVSSASSTSLSISSSASNTNTSIVQSSENSTHSSQASTSTSEATSSLAPTLNQDWVLVMGNLNPLHFYEIEETLPANLSAENVTNVYAIYHQNGTLFGYGYEAKVDGNGGARSNRFRVGLANGLYTGFQSLFNREHSGIGSVIMEALVDDLSGLDASYLLALGVMLDANATLTGLTASITLNGIAGALETITSHYLQKIEVE